MLYLHSCLLVTDVGVRAVAGLTKLTRLFLLSTSVTDAGLQHLHSLKNLAYIDLSFCDTSEAAEEELRQQIPGLYIRHDESDEDSELSD